MTAVAAPPIARVSASRESTIESVYPSVAATLIGRLIGSFLGSVGAIPITVVRVLVFIPAGSLMIPFGLLAYVWVKVFGSYHEVTNQAVVQRKFIGGNKIKEVSLADVADLSIVLADGYTFHRVGDVQLLNAQGNVLMTIAAIAHPQRLVHVIQEARDARVRADESLKHIQSRG